MQSNVTSKNVSGFTLAGPPCRCTSTFSALNYCSGIFFKSLSYLYEVVRTNFFRRFFGLFVIFDGNFVKIVAPPSDENENYVVHLKEHSLPKKNGENLVEIGQ